MSESLTIVIPVYNEENTILKVINDWSLAINRLNISFYLLIVNDGSTDTTNQILAKNERVNPNLKVLNQQNGGHGKAVMNGYQEALKLDTTYIFQTDSDDQFTPDDFEKMWKERHQCNALFGFRENRKDPMARLVITSILRKYIFELFGVNIPDANVPYRLFHQSFLKAALPIIPFNSFAPNIFLSILAFKYLENPTVVSIQHFDRKNDDAKLVKLGLIKACFKTFFQLYSFFYTLQNRIDYLHESYMVIKEDFEDKQHHAQEEYSKVA